MVRSPANNATIKDLGNEIIYENFAISLGILDKLKDNPWFTKYRVTLIDDSKIIYYKVNYINGKYPWENNVSFIDIIKGYINESKSNVLFSYNPNDFNKAITQMEQDIKEYDICSMEMPFSDGRRHYPGVDPELMNEYKTKEFEAQKDILNMLNNMLET